MRWTVSQYQNWLLEQKREGITIGREDAHTLLLHGTNAEGTVKVYPNDIIELAIVDDKGENCFYLHFHLDEDDHARELSEEMLAVMAKQHSAKTLRVLLSCTSALTTSWFAQQLNEAVKLLKIDMTFDAVSFDHIYEHGFDYDVILLAPQIGFRYQKAASIFVRQLVLKIPGQIFARYDTGALIQMVQKEYHRKMDEGVPEENTPLRSIYDNTCRILTIAVINHSDGNRFGYRIYDHGKVTLNKEVIKPDAGIQDMYDLLDYVLARHKNIDYIGVSVPGVINQGRVDEPRFGYHNINLGDSIMERYGIKAAVLNDVNAMALGYHAMHEGFDDMVFYFLPRGMQGGGAGVICHGVLERGYQHNAGEIGHLTDAVYPDSAELVLTPEGALKIVSLSMLAYITTIAPEKIVYYSALTPDPEEIRKELAKYISPDYIPEIIHVSRLKRYQLPGTMIRCLEVMKYDQANPGWWDEVLKKEKR